MPDNKDLVARLRRGPITVGVLDEAADRIEALEARSVPEGLETTAEERARWMRVLDELHPLGAEEAKTLIRDLDKAIASRADGLRRIDDLTRLCEERTAERDREAAARREAEYALRRFKEARDKLPDWEKLWAEQSERAEQAEAREATLRAALEKIANGNTSGYPGIEERFEETCIREMQACRDVARAALATTSAPESPK